MSTSAIYRAAIIMSCMCACCLLLSFLVLLPFIIAAIHLVNKDEYKMHLDSITLNQHVNCQYRRSFRSTVIVRTQQTDTHTHNRRIAVPGPLKWSINIMVLCSRYGRVAMCINMPWRSVQSFLGDE